MDFDSELTTTIDSIFATHFDAIYKYFYFRVLDKEEAEDLTSETFLALVDNMAKGKEITNHKAYLYGIAHNTFTSFLKRKYSQPLNGVDLEAFVQEIDTINSFDHSQIKTLAIKFIAQLPDSQKTILNLRLIEMKSLKEICEILQKDMNYVKVTQQRGINNLKKLLSCTPIST